jgi:molybdopterin-biosynthesis enzyme MoeA-like protein
VRGAAIINVGSELLMGKTVNTNIERQQPEAGI